MASASRPLTNLLDETIDALEKAKKTLDDIKYVTTSVYDYRTDTYKNVAWELIEFVQEARHFNYDPGFGFEQVDHSLRLVGDNWWMERVEYEGMEWWEFKTLPECPEEKGSGQMKLESVAIQRANEFNAQFERALKRNTVNNE